MRTIFGSRARKAASTSWVPVGCVDDGGGWLPEVPAKAKPTRMNRAEVRITLRTVDRMAHLLVRRPGRAVGPDPLLHRRALGIVGGGRERRAVARRLPRAGADRVDRRRRRVDRPQGLALGQEPSVVA